MDQNNKQVAVIIPAAGKAMRFGASKPKQYHLFQAATMLEHTVNIFISIPVVSRIIIAVDPDDNLIHTQSFITNPKITVVNGGSSRTASVFHAIQALEPNHLSISVVHDACRPWLKEQHFLDILHAFNLSKECKGIYPVIEMVDSLREKRNNDLVAVNR